MPGRAGTTARFTPLLGGKGTKVLLSGECLYLAIKYIAAMLYITG
jgi:hypothetical protein